MPREQVKLYQDDGQRDIVVSWAVLQILRGHSINKIHLNTLVAETDLEKKQRN